MLSGANSDNPALVLWRDLPDSAGWANLGAEHAARFAIADARNQRGGPEAFETGFGQCRMQGVVRAHFHALTATDAAGEEVGFVDETLADEATDRRGSCQVPYWRA